jgi:hemoglobin-like flavoprotein
MGWIKDLLGIKTPDEESRMSEKPRSPWTPTEPDDDTKRHTDWIKDLAPGEQVAEGSHADPADVIAHSRAQGSQTSFAEGGRRLGVGTDPIADSGVHYVGDRVGVQAPGLAEPPPAPVESTPVPDNQERCSMCGAVIPGDHDLLTEVLGWLAPSGEDFVRQFYVDLFAYDPELRPLFPAEIKIQEEKLLTAIVSLLKLFKAGDEEMEQLNAALAKFGRSHTRFEPAATIEEYTAVWQVLAGVAHAMLGDKLTDRHVAALRRAYEYAAGMMLAAQATARLTGVGRRRRTV